MPKISDLPVAPSTDFAAALVVVIAGVTYQIPLTALLVMPTGQAITMQGSGAEIAIDGAGAAFLRNALGSRIRAAVDGSLNIVATDPAPITVDVGPSGAVEFRVDTNPTLSVVKDASGNLAVQLYGQLATANEFAGSTLGSVVGGIPVFDPSGVLLGNIPLYDTIT